MVNAPLGDTDPNTRIAAALERIARGLENANLIAAYHASLEPGSEYELPTELGQALNTQQLTKIIAEMTQPAAPDRVNAA